MTPTDDGNACTDDTCNPANGTTTHTIDQTNTCSDSDACTQTDSCNPAGVCVGSNPVTPTDDGNACTDDTCNPANGSTIHTIDQTNTCSDGDACTQTDSCNPAGVCVGSNPDPVCAGCGSGNAPPVVTGTTSSNPLPINGSTNASVSASFTDTIGQTHTCSINWGDSSSGPGTVNETNGSGTCTGSHAYAPPTEPVVYTVTITITDNCGAADEGTTYVVFYDPNGGFVTGGGWINSPAGAYTPNPTLTGKANFGFVSKYKKGSAPGAPPEGETNFHFNAADFRFDSDSYEWLVISGAKARYRGVGKVNGAGSYGFELTAVDGQVSGGGGIDKFRIKIWDQNQGNGVVYDNQVSFGTCTDTTDGATPCSALGGGSIVIHKGK